MKFTIEKLQDGNYCLKMIGEIREIYDFQEMLCDATYHIPHDRKTYELSEDMYWNLIESIGDADL